MRYSFVLGLALMLAPFPVSAEMEPDDLVAPAFYAGLSFGGAGGVHEPRLGLQLHAARTAARSGGPALVQLEIRLGGAEFAVAGHPLRSFGDAPASTNTEGGERRSRAGSAITIGVLGTAAVLGLVSLVMEEAAEDLGEEISEEAVQSTFPGATDDGGGDPPPCDGVQVGDECVLGD